jgi:peptidoglycan/LPS O-acetylase OafA/YrhL
MSDTGKVRASGYAGMDPRIDRLRGLLAIGVMLGHAIDLCWVSTTGGDSVLFQIANASRPYLGFGCVVGFIVLSGYCIARSTEKGFTLAHYTARRVTRLYPLLIVATLLTAVFEWIALDSPHRPAMWGGPIDTWRFLYTMAGVSGFKGHFGALAPSYTISYELLYYAVWGLVLTVTRGRHRLGWLLACVISALLILYGWHLRQALGAHRYVANALALALLPAWLLGAGLALFERPLTAIGRYLPVWPLWLVLGLVFGYWYDLSKKPRVSPTDTSDVIYFAVIATLLVITIAAWRARPARESRTDTWLGELSYPLFLIHGPAIMAIQFAMNVWGVKASFPVTMGYMLASAFVMALLLTVLVERPLMAWRRRERRVLQPRAAAAA